MRGLADHPVTHVDALRHTAPMNPNIDPSPGTLRTPARSRRRWLWPAVAAGAVVLAAATAAVTMALTGHSTNPQPAAKRAAPVATTTPASVAASSAAASPSASGEPRTYDGAKAAVDKIEAAGKAHDGGTGWDMLTAAGQATMSRSDYIKVVQGCPKLTDSTTVLSIALNAGGSSATVTESVPPGFGGQSYEWRMIYEAGHWKHQPSDGAMTWMGLGADKALTVLRNNGQC